MKRSLHDIAIAVEARLIGENHADIQGVSSLVSASHHDLVFVEDEKHLDAALKSRAGAIIAGEFAASRDADRPLLISAHPKLAFARAAQLLRDEYPANENDGVHSTAIVHPLATLETGVQVRARAVIGEGARIKNGTRIDEGAVIGAGVTIGSDCEVYPNVTIYAGTNLGDRVIVHAGAVLGSDGFGYVRDRETGHYEKFPQVGRLVIEDDVEIGANSTIDRGATRDTIIGEGTKIDNLVQIGHNVSIGRHCLIVSQVGISGSVTVGDFAVLAGQVGVADHLTIGEGAVLGARAGVMSNVPAGGRWGGFPAEPAIDWKRGQAIVRRLVKRKKAARKDESEGTQE